MDIVIIIIALTSEYQTVFVNEKLHAFYVLQSGQMVAFELQI